MNLHYRDADVELWQGDAAATLRELPAGGVDCVVTSPPYFGSRDYGVDGQLGAEPTPAAYVDALVAAFREVRRVLADDGTVWLNLGDSYAAGGTVAGEPPPKNLLGIPWRVAFALQADGWTVRNAIVWHKPNAMPESVTDRLSSRHELVFLLSRSPRYWFELDAIRTEHAREWTPGNNGGRRGWADAPRTSAGLPDAAAHPLGANPGDVWEIATAPFAGAHFATMPVALAERCVRAGCKPGGTVLDPFAGSCTTGLAAARHGRRFVGVDLNAEYLDLAIRTRLAQPALRWEQT